MTQRIAIIGWGSLLWHSAPEFDAWHGDWNFEGPVIPIEFARVSPKRAGALTLIVDPVHGEPTQTAFALSKRETVEEAYQDLMAREWGKTPEVIGRHVRGREPEPSDGPAAAIAAWAAAMDIDAVVWTAFTNNFREKTGVEFSVPAAKTYVKNLPRDEQERAVHYIHRAPDFVRTPLRLGLLDEEWFCRLAEELCSPPARAGAGTGGKDEPQR